MRRKWMALLVIIMLCVLLANAFTTEYIDRVFYMMAATVLLCVWISCETRLDVASMPVVFKDEKPPEEKEQ